MKLAAYFLVGILIGMCIRMPSSFRNENSLHVKCPDIPKHSCPKHECSSDVMLLEMYARYGTCIEDLQDAREKTLRQETVIMDLKSISCDP